MVKISVNILLLEKIMKPGIEGLYFYESLMWPVEQISQIKENIYFKIEKTILLFYYVVAIEIFLF